MASRKPKKKNLEEPKQNGLMQFIPLITALIWLIVELIKKL